METSALAAITMVLLAQLQANYEPVKKAIRASVKAVFRAGAQAKAKPSRWIYNAKKKRWVKVKQGSLELKCRKGRHRSLMMTGILERVVKQRGGTCTIHLGHE